MLPVNVHKINVGQGRPPAIDGRNPRDRSRGIGRIVPARLVERARELGWPEMVVSGIYTDNPRARRLYERAGFTITGEIPAEQGRTQRTMTLKLGG
jgi:ribosomal protein S18 acetylase RimI-like enzyme